MDQQPPVFKEQFSRAQVVDVLEEASVSQKVKIKLLDGPDNTKEFEIDHGDRFRLTEHQKVNQGDLVVVYQTTSVMGTSPYQIIDKYRLDSIGWITALFLMVIIVMLGIKKGAGSIIGLSLSILVIILFIIPQILSGKDPVFITITGALFIMITTIYLAHGFSKQTSIAVLSTFITLIFTAILSILFVKVAHLTGLGSEAAYGLTLNADININLKGLLLGGMILGTLGVLDDITTAQAATVFELKKANSSLKFADLIKRGLNVGKEHISSLVNTLMLAYAGVALPFFIILALNPTDKPWWFMLNMEAVSEEIIRTLAGSMGLILAVPITTILAAWAISKIRN